MMDEAIDYFTGEPGFARLFVRFKEKYESLGRIGGTVTISDFSERELESVARFLGRTINELRQAGKVSLIQFERQLERTRFHTIDLFDLLEAFFEKPLLSKKEQKQSRLAETEAVLYQLQEEWKELSFWFDYLRQKNADSYWIHKFIEETPNVFQLTVHWLGKAFHELPSKYERLPIFSNRITRDPHAFDLNTTVGKLWLHLLAVHSAKDSESVNVPTDSESMNDLLLSYNILRDDITNAVTVANLIAETNEGIHPVWKAAAETNSVLNIPLREMVQMDRAYPKVGNQVWVIENSGVYSSILDECPNAPIICTQGQFKLTALLLMDLLVNANCELVYSGDLDPEGVGMAARLLERYPNHLTLWKMDVDQYSENQSEASLTTERLNKLNSITAPALQPLIERMKQDQKASYQEAFIEEMIDELNAVLPV